MALLDEMSAVGLMHANVFVTLKYVSLGAESLFCYCRHQYLEALSSASAWQA